jgi:hypothetical protein
MAKNSSPTRAGICSLALRVPEQLAAVGSVAAPMPAPRSGPLSCACSAM